MGNEDRQMSNNKGSVVLSCLMLFCGVAVIIMFTAVAAYQQMIVGVMHNIKNDLYMVNRNVLLALERDSMGEDNYGFYEKDVKGLIQDEIKRLWNTDVSCNTEHGIIDRADVLEAKIINKNKEMEIETKLKIKLKPLIFSEVLTDKLVFQTKESTKIRKMRSYEDEQ